MLLIGAVLIIHGVDNSYSLLGTLWAFWGMAMCSTRMTVLSWIFGQCDVPIAQGAFADVRAESFTPLPRIEINRAAFAQ
ncbi:hypothetical protein FHT76_008408 [Rhizobium sp. BK176]|nr:hypothetical protein [Rhizobium sp. BK399]MCS4096685.1 hypothetical protein [Rhizobium sp. BK176]